MPLRAALILALLVAGLSFAPSAAAHASKTTDDGKYRVTWGFLDEPAFTHQKNRLDLIIRDNATGEGVGGLTADNLTVVLRFGEEEYNLGAVSAYRGAKGASAGPGNYTSANHVYITRPGIYSLVVRGDIHGTPVDLVIPAAHDYEPMTEIMFPEDAPLSGGDVSDFEARIAALEQKVAELDAKLRTQATTPTSVTSQPTKPAPGFEPLLVLAALAAVAGVVAWRRRA